MSISNPVKAFQIKSHAGSEVHGDPYRMITTYINAETGEILDVVDHYVNEERIRIVQELRRKEITS